MKPGTEINVRELKEALAREFNWKLTDRKLADLMASAYSVFLAYEDIMRDAGVDVPSVVKAPAPDSVKKYGKDARK